MHFAKLVIQEYFSTGELNPLMPKSDLYILLFLMPDDFARQRETPWALKS